MIFKYSAGIWFVLTGLETLLGLGIPSWFLGVLALIAGIALIADR